MTNRLAIILGMILVGLIAADVFLAGGANLLFLGRKFFVLIEWLAFWR